MQHQYCALYRARNLVNGKEYYGVSVNPQRRWSTHKTKAFSNGDTKRSAFSSAIGKHGADAFKFEIVLEEHGPDAVVRCKEAEVLAISLFESRAPNGYNITEGGEGVSGWAMSDEHKAIISFTHKGTRKSKQACEKLRQTLNQPDVKAKRSASLKAAANRPGAKAKRAAAARLSHARPEVKVKLAAASIEVNARPEVKAKIAASSKEYANRPDVVARVSAWAKEYNNRPEVKAAKLGANAPGARPVLCSNGMYFVTMVAAVEWLRSIGHTKAAAANLHKPLRNPKATAYGFTWRYAETNESLEKE